MALLQTIAKMQAEMEGGVGWGCVRASPRRKDQTAATGCVKKSLARCTKRETRSERQTWLSPGQMAVVVLVVGVGGGGAKNIARSKPLQE